MWVQFVAPDIMRFICRTPMFAGGSRPLPLLTVKGFFIAYQFKRHTKGIGVWGDTPRLAFDSKRGLGKSPSEHYRKPDIETARIRWASPYPLPDVLDCLSPLMSVRLIGAHRLDRATPAPCACHPCSSPPLELALDVVGSTLFGYLAACAA